MFGNQFFVVIKRFLKKLKVTYRQHYKNNIIIILEIQYIVSKMESKMVTFPSNGGTCPGYLALPDSKSGLGVVVIQEWWGLVDHIKDVANRFAKEGFVALAPDLYHGKASSDPGDAGKLAMAMKIDEAEKDLRGAVKYLLSLKEVKKKKIGTVGFCMGGALSLFAGCINPDVSACVIYYGARQDVKPNIAQLNAKVLGFFGEKDKGVPPELVHKLEAELKAAKKSVEFYIYPECGHAFFNDTRPQAYNAQRAKESWGKMLEFYKKNI